MIWPSLLLVIVVGLHCCSAQQLLSSVTYDNCDSAIAGSPCVTVQLATGGRDGASLQTPYAVPCSVAPDNSEVMISDYRGLTVRSCSNMNSLQQDVSLNCSAHLVSLGQYLGKFWMTYSAHGNSVAETVEQCACDSASACHYRVLRFKSTSGLVLDSKTPITPFGSRGVNNFDVDVVEAPLIRLNCSGPSSTWVWLNATQTEPNAVLLRDSNQAENFCPLEFTQTYQKWGRAAGYSAYFISRPPTAGYPSVGVSFEVPGFAEFDLFQDDAIVLAGEISAGHNLNVSWGPSFVSSTTVSGDVPAGLMSVDPATGDLSRDTSQFQVATELISEAHWGGRADILWATALDADSSTVAKIDMSTNPPTYTIYDGGEPTMRILGPSICPLLDGNFAPYDGTGKFPLDCPIVDPNLTSFSFALSGSTNERSHSFFSEAGSTYMVVEYNVNFPCVSCFFFTSSEIYNNIDLWDVTLTPVLVDRFTYNKLIVGNALVHMQVANGVVFFNNGTASPSNEILWIGVQSSGFVGDFTTPSRYFDPEIGVDAVVYEMRLIGGLLAVNWGVYGTTFYNIDGAGVVGVNTSISSGQQVAAGLGSGPLTSCGELSCYVRANGVLAAAGSVGGAYESITTESYDVLSSPPSPSSDPSPSAIPPSPSAPPLGTPSVVPSASAIPPPPPCPDTCMYDCTYIEPSKLPKPSVKPSKQPAATKVPEPEFFIIELTYESAAADCGPDCCEVREWLGDDTVAASFYMCSEDSQTKNRAPEYDDKAGTCSIFLAAQEGSDPGQISQAEFDAAVATLEGNFATLCTDAKNCDASTQSGKSASYIIGGGAGSVVASVLLLIAAMAALL